MGFDLITMHEGKEGILGLPFAPFSFLAIIIFFKNLLVDSVKIILKSLPIALHAFALLGLQPFHRVHELSLLLPLGFVALHDNILILSDLLQMSFDNLITCWFLLKGSPSCLPVFEHITFGVTFCAVTHVSACFIS